MKSIVIQHLSFTHSSASQSLFENVTLHFDQGWTGIVGPNGSGKTTLMQLICGNLEPQTGSISRKGLMVYCPQRTDDEPESFEQFLETTDPDGARLRGLLKIAPDWRPRWASLSQGERKRVQIGMALWRNPDVLCVDEPTNHLDTQAMDVLKNALETFSGVGILVSHDRVLLDALCHWCVFIDPPEVLKYPGNFSQAIDSKEQEDDSREDERERLKKEAARLQGVSNKRQHEARAADQKRSKRHLDKNDSDGRARINLGILTGKDGVAGKLARQIQGRVQKKEEQLNAVAFKKRYEMDFWLSAQTSQRDFLFRAEPTELPLGETKKLKIPELIMGPTDRIALVGPNGAGKSVLIRHLLTILTVPSEKTIYIPQEIDLAQTQAILAELRSLPKQEMGIAYSVISCLGSRPERIRESETPSPGEARKILLALGIAREPQLIILDEPTNHLDLPAIQLLENALRQCPCGLFLVSHDTRFLSALSETRWSISCHAAGNALEFQPLL
jgi:ATPase subunit of ABC transporter with duplicated ATPase domains